MAYRVTRRKFVAATAGAAAWPLGACLQTAAADDGAGHGEPLPGLEDYCRRAIADWRVPGIAVAVIRDGKLRMARGFGVRELGKGAAVDENTIFPIASCTKSFTAALAGRLVDQGALRWDDLLSKHVPGLVVPARGQSAKTTIRQALQHRTGLPAANMLWRSGAFDAHQILRRVRYLKPVAAPGERFLYNNVMYLAAGKLIEHAGGKSWGDCVESHLFEPLGMNASLADSTKLSDFDNLATPHATVSGEVKRCDRYCPDVIAPAGAIHSTAADMARWLIMHLDQGRFGSRQLLSAARVDEMHTPVEPPPKKLSTKDVPRAPIGRYAMGWFVNEHAGRRVVEHSGTQSGFVSWMAIMPAERLGVVILSNHHRTGINFALRSWILDRLLKRPDYDWSRAVRKDYTHGWQRLLREAKAEFDAGRPPEEPASQPLADYAGAFESRLYGTIRVTEKDGRLNLRFGTRFQGKLRAWQGDTFRAFFPNPRLDDWLVTFAVVERTVASLRVQEAPWAPSWYDDRDDLGEFIRR